MMPPTPPMSDAPPPPLPVNPRMSQPSPKNSFQAQQEADLLGLQEMKNTPAGGPEDLNDQNMGMGGQYGWLPEGLGKATGVFRAVGASLGRPPGQPGAPPPPHQPGQPMPAPGGA